MECAKCTVIVLRPGNSDKSQTARGDWLSRWRAAPERNLCVISGANLRLDYRYEPELQESEQVECGAQSPERQSWPSR